MFGLDIIPRGFPKTGGTAKANINSYKNQKKKGENTDESKIYMLTAVVISKTIKK